MHLALTFLSKHGTHRVKSMFSPTHVIIQGRRFMCVRCCSGKIGGCWTSVELDFGKREVDIPFVVAEDTVCSQSLKHRLVGSLRQTIASRAVGHCLVHFNLEAMCQLFPCLGLEQLVSIGDDLSRASFESNHSAKEHVDEVVSRHVLATRYKHPTLRKPFNHG